MSLIAEYLQHGWGLVPLLPGTQGPRIRGWNNREALLQSAETLPPDFGVGLAHAYSGTMAFDIDDWDQTVQYGIDLEKLYAASDSVVIDSGRPGHGKLLYRMPLGLILPSKQIQIDKKMVFELRCGTEDQDRKSVV